MEILRNNLVKYNQSGFTMIELMISLAIMALLAVLVIPSFTSLRSNVALGNASRELQSALRVAQNRAMVAQNGTDHGVHLESNYYVLFGGSWSTPNYTNVVNLPAGIVISGAAGQTVTFDRLSGLPTAAQVVTLQAGSNQEMVQIDTSGLISLP